MDEKIMWQMPLKPVSDFIQFYLVNFAKITSSDVSVNGFLVSIS